MAKLTFLSRESGNFTIDKSFFPGAQCYTITYTTPQMVEIYPEFIPVDVTVDIEEMTASIRERDYALFMSPNPCHGQTVINFTLPHTAYTTLKIYDTIGRLVAQPVKGEVSAGRHSISYSTEEIPAGVYFVQLESDGIRLSTILISN